MSKYRSTVLFLALHLVAVLVLAPTANASGDLASSRATSMGQPIDVIRAYLQALNARDNRAAYRYISALDRAVRDEKTYVNSRTGLDGFALKLAWWFAAEMKVRVIDELPGVNKTRFEVGYNVPTGDEIAPQLFDWNQEKLNSLTATNQQRLMKTLEDLKASGKMVTIEGQETLDLVREKDGWKIFLDWPRRTRVIFKFSASFFAGLQVRFRQNDYLVAANEPFQVDFTIKNLSPTPLVAKLNHRIEPSRFAPDVSLIACGLLSPFTLLAHETRELSSSYIVGGNIPPRSQLAIIYDFVIKARSRSFP